VRGRYLKHTRPSARPLLHDAPDSWQESRWPSRNAERPPHRARTRSARRPTRLVSRAPTFEYHGRPGRCGEERHRARQGARSLASRGDRNAPHLRGRTRREGTQRTLAELVASSLTANPTFGDL